MAAIKLFGAMITVKCPVKVDHDHHRDRATSKTTTSSSSSSSSDQGMEGDQTKKPDKIIPCPSCKSMETKFCYFNNYNVNQQRHFCKGCHRYWTAGGVLRNVPVGAGRRKSRHLPRHLYESHPRVTCSAAESSGTASEMAEKEGGIIEKGHDECMKLAISVLGEFELPLGLLPLADVIEAGFVRSTGYVWIVQKKKVEHTFEMISKLVSYDVHITGYMEKKGIKKLKGVKAKELMLWHPINEITVDDHPLGKIHFKSRAGITKTFPVEAFASGQLLPLAI